MKLVDFGLVALLLNCGVIYVGHLDGYFCCPKSVKKQAAYNGLLFNLAVPSVPQGRQWDTCKLNLDKPGCRRYTGYLVHSVIVRLLVATLHVGMTRKQDSGYTQLAQLQ